MSLHLVNFSVDTQCVFSCITKTRRYRLEEAEEVVEEKTAVFPRKCPLLTWDSWHSFTVQWHWQPVSWQGFRAWSPKNFYFISFFSFPLFFIFHLVPRYKNSIASSSKEGGTYQPTNVSTFCASSYGRLANFQVDSRILPHVVASSFSFFCYFIFPKICTTMSWFFRFDFIRGTYLNIWLYFCLFLYWHSKLFFPFILLF